MGIGAVSAYGGMNAMLNSYKINSVYGNPKSMQPVGKIGEDNYSGNPFAVLSKNEDDQKIREQQSKEFDYVAALERAKSGLATAPSDDEGLDILAEMERMMTGSRFSAATIPTAELMLQ